MGSGKSGQVVGYRYFLGADLKWAHAPIDSINKIYVDNRIAWEGTLQSGDITINKPELFGEFEGGVSGLLNVVDGDPTQLQNPYLVEQLGTGVPAYRGVTSTVLNQMYLGNNPYLKGWTAEFTRIRRRLKDGVVIPQWNEPFAPVPPFSNNEDGYSSLSRYFGGTLTPQQILIQIDLSSHANGFSNNFLSLPGQGQNLIATKNSVISFLLLLQEQVTWNNGDVDLGIAFFRGSTGAVNVDNNGNPDVDPNTIIEGNFYNAPRRGVFIKEGLTKADIPSLIDYVNALTVYPDTDDVSPTAIGENATDFFSALSAGDKYRVNFTFSPFSFPGVAPTSSEYQSSVAALNTALSGGTGVPNKVAFTPTGVTLSEVLARNTQEFFGYTSENDAPIPSGWINIPNCDYDFEPQNGDQGWDWIVGQIGFDDINGACLSPAGWGQGPEIGGTVPNNASVVAYIGLFSTARYFSLYAFWRDLSDPNAGPWVFNQIFPDGTTGPLPQYEMIEGSGGGTVSTDNPNLVNLFKSLGFTGINLSSALDMNPAHIIREALTDQQWGLGIPDEEVDEASFYNASVALYNERFGLSLVWNRQTEVEEFIKTILDHIDAVLYVRRDTGRWTLKLIRYDYDPNTIPVFDDDDVVSWDQVTRKSEAELVNSVTVKFSSRSLRGPASLTVNNLAQIQQLGAVVPATVNYPGIWQQGLASVVAERDLRSLSTATISGSISVTRRGATLYPGDVFRLSSARYGLSGEIMRVVEVNIGDGRDNAVFIKFVQDVFNLGTIPITGGGSSEWQDILTSPQPVQYRVVEEEGYRSFYRRNGEQLANEILTFEPNAGYLSAYGEAPSSDSINARVRYDDGSGYSNGGLASFCPTGLLANDVTRLATDTTWVLTQPKGLVSVGVNTLAYVNGEYVRVDSVNTTTNTITVGRGCLDTIPEFHAAGSRVFFFEGEAAFTTNQFVDSDVVSVKLLTNSGLGQLSEALAPVDNLEFDARINRPYPVGKLQIGGSYEDTLYTGTLSISWAHRDRTLQTGAIPEDHTAGNIGPEAGVSYTVKGLEYDFNNAFIGELFSLSAGTDTTLSVDTSLYPMTVDPGYVKVVVETDRSGLVNRASPYINCFTVIDPATFDLAVAWYDANVLSSMSLEADGVDPVEFDEDPVGEIENLKGTVL